jgi:hypothetical protein
VGPLATEGGLTLDDAASTIRASFPRSVSAQRERV